MGPDRPPSPRQVLDREYSPSSVARDAAGTLGRYRALGDAARARRHVLERVSYGPAAAEVCHVFPAPGHGAGDGAALVFVHGGHWQSSGIDDGCFAAGHALDAGLAFVAVGYGLAPARPLVAMIASVVRALRHLAEHGPRYGIDPARLHVSGSSAGAHLLAAALTRPGCPRVRSATLLSGLYDLSEIPRTSVNDALGLTARTAVAASPVRMPAPACDQVRLAAGRHETGTYVRQQQVYTEHLRSLGVPVEATVVPDRDHFDLPLDLADTSTPFGRSGPYLPRRPEPARPTGK